MSTDAAVKTVKDTAATTINHPLYKASGTNIGNAALGVFAGLSEDLARAAGGINKDAPPYADELPDPDAPPSASDSEAAEAARRRRRELAMRLGHRGNIFAGPRAGNVGVAPTLLGA